MRSAINLGSPTGAAESCWKRRGRADGTWNELAAWAGRFKDGDTDADDDGLVAVIRWRRFVEIVAAYPSPVLDLQLAQYPVVIVPQHPGTTTSSPESPSGNSTDSCSPAERASQCPGRIGLDCDLTLTRRDVTVKIGPPKGAEDRRFCAGSSESPASRNNSESKSTSRRVRVVVSTSPGPARPGGATNEQTRTRSVGAGRHARPFPSHRRLFPK
eukprot:3771001-Rhodomonas_salina.1